MVALTIGLFLLGGLTQVYLSNKQSYNTGESLSRMQENLRFAAEAIAQDVRMAGFMPCRQTDKVANVVVDSSSTWWLDFYNMGISGYDGDNTDDDTGLDDHGNVGIPDEFTSPDPGAYVADTDIVIMLRGGESSYSVVKHNPSAASFQINRISDLDKGDIVMICDLTNSAITQLTQAHPVNVTIVHSLASGGNPSPGNCTKGLGFPAPDPCDGADKDPLGKPHTFGPDSHVVKFSPRAYYIGTNASGGRSLYKAILNNNAGDISMGVSEVVEGIENMQILYGVDTTDSGYANKFVRADEVMDVATWKDVVSVRIGFIAQTPREIALENDTDEYTIAGTTVDPDDEDRKQRYQYNTTIKIRNRGAR